VLQAFNRTAMTGCTLRIAQVLAVVLNQFIEFGAACIQNTSKIERNVRRMIRVGFAEFIGPVAEKLTFVSAFFGNLDGVFVHINGTTMKVIERVLSAFACTYHA
jgi:hypothetical protein